MRRIRAHTPRSRFARLIAERDAYRSKLDDLANAIGAHCFHHPRDAHEADSELWNAYRYVMGHDPDRPAQDFTSG
jgi:hypothetical protein